MGEDREVKINFDNDASRATEHNSRATELEKEETPEKVQNDETEVELQTEDQGTSESETEEEEKGEEENTVLETIEKIISESDLLLVETEQLQYSVSDKKQVLKRLRYCAENQYKLIETLDRMELQRSFTEARELKRHTIRKIQKRVDQADNIIHD